MSQTIEIESFVVLRGIGYRVQLADEWTVIFTQDAPVAMRPTKFMFHRNRQSIWNFEFVDAWGDSVAACHISAAYEWCKARLGDDHAQQRLPINPIVPHDLYFDDQRKSTFCRACGQRLNDRLRFTSCTSTSEQRP